MTEHGVFGDFVTNCSFKGINVVNALARKGALAKQVLVDVRHGKNVRINAAGGGIDALEFRALPPHRKGWGDAGLQDAIALDDAPFLRIKARLIEGMCHFADEPARGVARQPRVGIECDDIADIVRHGAHDLDEACIVRTPEQAVQFMQLATFTFPAHPGNLGGVPLATAMQQQKAVGQVACVELFDASHGLLQQRLIGGAMLRLGVGPVSEKCEIQITIGIGEIMHLKAAHHVVHIVMRCEKHGNDDDGAQVRWYAISQGKARKGRGVQNFRHSKIDDGHSKIAGGENAQRCNKNEER